MTPARERTVFFGLVFAGAMLMWYALGQNWATVTVGMPDPTPDSHETITGLDLMAEAGIAPWFALGSMAGFYATRRVGRVVIGALLIWMSGAVAWGMWDELTPETLTGPYQGRGAEEVTLTAVHHGWWALALAGTALIFIAGAFACVRGAAWPRMGARYDRARSRTPAPAPGATRSSGPEDMWAALDAGADPTASPPAQGGRQDIKEQ